MSHLTYGYELPDCAEKIAAVTDAQIGLLSDLRELFQARILLEKDYASKLQALVRKANEKKSKRLSKVIFGPEPFRVWNEESLKSSTLNQAYTALITSLESTAQDHTTFADSLNRVTDSMKTLEIRNDNIRKKQAQFYEKLISVKEKTVADKIKAKTKYDEECSEMESYRLKQGRASDDKHAERAAKQMEHQKNDMLNCKNAYLTTITISNRVKNRFYEQDLVLVENQYQTIQADFLTSITEVLQQSQNAGLTHLDSLKSRLISANDSLSLIDPSKEQELFVEYNRNQTPFSIPDDYKFEPCQGFYDNDELSIEPAPKVYLQNKLLRCREKLQELQSLLAVKQSEVDKLQKLKSAYIEDPALGSLQDVRESLLDAEHVFTNLSVTQVIYNAEVDLLIHALGDDQGAQNPHSFKSSSFSIPTQCGYCKSSIWGLSKQGKTCKTCHISVHSKCELKIPANCTGGADGKAAKAAEHAHTRTSPTPPTVYESDQSPTSSFTSGQQSVIHEEAHPDATVQFDFEASSTFELSVSAGDSVQLLEVDDGSGWIKVSDRHGRKGLIPATYVELSETEKADEVSQIPESSGAFVHVLYSYESNGPDELSITEGERIQLTTGPEGGQNYADGWWEAVKDGRKGIFPSNYVELV